MPQNAKIQDLTPIARRFRLADVYVFGSRAKEIAAKLKGENSRREIPDSDIDIGIRPLQGVRLRPRDLVSIAIELEDLFDAKRVDLVLLPGADPYLAYDIIRGELLYAEDPIDQARYELFVLRRAADLLPFKKERLEMILGGAVR